jgi:hypothetical protein
MWLITQILMEEPTKKLYKLQEVQALFHWLGQTSRLITASRKTIENQAENKILINTGINKK